MRIVAGKWEGRSLVSPSGRVRPTAEAVRDAWMSTLSDRLRDARVLDLYAGSGALGLEAVSRGAASCDFVELDPSALHALKANIAALRLRNSTRIFKRDALEFVRGLDQHYDLVFADPPYGSRQLDRLVEAWLTEPFSTLLAVEHAADHPLAGRPRWKRFGDTMVSIYEDER
jgi:16S rRNA (guanine966-N2)-methyltransferase